MGRYRAALVAALTASALGLLHAAPPARTAPPASDRLDLSVKALVTAATNYVTRYEQDFAFLIADESYAQTRMQTSVAVQSRVLQSEFFLTFLPADNEWVAVRDVVQVDGERVTNREDLRTLLASRAEFRGLIAQVIERNARYNIGITRNFNEPTLPLLLMEPKRVGDVRFERGAVTRDGDVTLATLVFAERGRPTLVRGPGGPMPAKGEIVIEADTGVVRRTRFDLNREGVKVRLTTDYALDAKLGLWLPAVFTERYDTDSLREVVVCLATYSNYRRFEVNARIR